MNRVDTTNKLIKRLTVSLAVVAAFGVQVVCAQNHNNNEFFGGNSTAPKQKPYTNFQGPAPVGPANGVTAKGAGALDSDASPEVAWFEKFDGISYHGRPTDTEKIVLNMPFNQEAERVQKWTQTAGRVAKRYRETANALGYVHAPQGRAELDDYCNMRRQWFNDAASVYEEMIKPRQPAQTIEDLKEQLNQVKENAGSLQKENVALLNMDRTMRRKYRVHANQQIDKLFMYINGRQAQPSANFPK